MVRLKNAGYGEWFGFGLMQMYSCADTLVFDLITGFEGNGAGCGAPRSVSSNINGTGHGTESGGRIGNGIGNGFNAEQPEITTLVLDDILALTCQSLTMFSNAE